MFSSHSGKRLPKLSEVHQFWSLSPQGKLVIEFLTSIPKITPSLDERRVDEIQIPACGPVENVSTEHAPADRFMDANNARLLDFSFPQLSDSYGARERSGLPPNFVGNFCLNRIFTRDWEDADFTHALTGLDYLTNLECTRRTALREAADRLHINKDTWQSTLADNNRARVWVCEIQKKEREIDLCYSSLWVDLRVWAMSKELLSEPFYKPNAVAMLNTLFPPVIKVLPSPRITANALYQHRNFFYRHIVFIEVNGKAELGDFVDRLHRPGTGHTWLDVRQALKDYITLADSMIREASQVHGISFFKDVSDVHPALRPTRLSRAESSQSDPASISSSSAKPTPDELRRVSTKSGITIETENTGSLNSSIVSKDSPGSSDFTRFFGTRSGFPGKIRSQRISSQDDIDTFFRDSPQPPWYSSPIRPSSSGGQSLEASINGARLHSSSFSRPFTPSIRSLTSSVEQQRFHSRSVSANKRISYDFHNTLPGTPELPSPQAHEKKSFSGNPNVSRATSDKEKDVFIEEQIHPEVPAARKKKSGFTMFRRTKKLENALGSQPTIRVLRNRSSRDSMSVNSDDSRNIARKPADKLDVPGQGTLKKKSSFRFLQHKSHEDHRAASDSNSDRTVTETAGPKVKPKRSLTNLFMNKGAMTSSLRVDTGENSRDTTNTPRIVSGFRHTLRKVRSYGSVKSSGSIHSTDGAMKVPNSSILSLVDNDRVITSADIDEPFPFGNFVQPQTPAMLFEDPEERLDNEDVRKALLEKARNERMAKWEQSEESKRKLEASRQKRRVLRDEMDANVEAAKTARQKQIEATEKQKARQGLLKAVPQTPNPGLRNSDKPPKTPMRERVLKIVADSYSPTSPVLNY